MDGAASSSIPSPHALVFRASALMDAKRPNEAIPLLLRAVVGSPGNSHGLCLLSLAYLQVNQPHDALAAAQDAAAAAPGSEWPHRLRASALIKLGRPREALVAARQAVASAPLLPECHILLAEAEVANRHIKAARSAAEQARALAPDRPGGHVILSMVALRSRRWAEAEAHARAALGVDPQNTAALNNLGVALQNLGRRREAVHYLGTASRLDPRNSLYKTNAVRAATRFWGPAVVLVLIGIEVLSGEVLSAIALAVVATGVRVVIHMTQGDVRGLWRLPLERWNRRRTPSADPKASPELMRALRKERRAINPGAHLKPKVALMAGLAIACILLAGGFVIATIEAAVTRHFASTAVNLLFAAAFGGAAGVLLRACGRRG